MEECTKFKREEILDWTLAEFKFELRYLAWKGHIDKKYNDIMMEKAKRK